MANDRLFLACRTCGEPGPLLAKWWGGEAAVEVDIQNITAEQSGFLSRHLLMCRPDEVAPGQIAGPEGSWVYLVNEEQWDGLCAKKGG